MTTAGASRINDDSPSARVTAGLPLAVDLDGSLSASDSLLEALVTVLLRKPFAIPSTLMALMRGKYALKEHLSRIDAYSSESLPLRDDVVSFLEEQRASGRRLYLVTAAHQSVADRIAARVGLFDTAIGSTDGVNLKGAMKAEKLREMFPDGFAYAGNDRSDLAIWRDAKSSVLIGTPPSVTRAVDELGIPVERSFPTLRPAAKTWLRAIRVHQWTKNILLFVPLVLAHKYDDFAMIGTVSLGFIAMGLVASATYLVNDLSDLAADRGHPTKRNRPIAKGEITAGQAIVAAGGLGLAGFAIATILSPAFALLLVAYVVLTVAYSLRLKAIALLDVFVLGVLYTLRIFMGIVLAGVTISPWLLVFSLFLFYSLSMAKRHVEVVRAAQRGHVGRIKGRGYEASDAPLTLALGVASSLASVMLLFLYVANDAYPVGAYHRPEWLWLIALFVFLWTTRIWLKSHRAKLDDDPIVFALRDPPSWLLGSLVVATFALAVYA